MSTLHPPTYTPTNHPLSPSSGKNIPLHVVVETVPLCGMGVEELRGRIEMDSYALIPAHTRFTDLLQAALVKLGYSEELTQARGGLQALEEALKGRI